MNEIVFYLILHFSLYATTAFCACWYMTMFTWENYDAISVNSLVALVMPSFAAAAALVFAFGVGWVASEGAALWILIGDALIYIGSGVFVWIKAIKNYNDCGYAPQRATFYLVMGYSFVIFAGSVALVFFI